MPCSKRYLRLRMWEEEEFASEEVITKIHYKVRKRKSSNSSPYLSNWCKFPLALQLDPLVKVFRYYYLHTTDDFLGDVGGYCDLFLGLSFLSFISLVKTKLKTKFLGVS